MKKIIKCLGIILIIFGFLANPFIIEYFLIPDKKLSFLLFYIVIIFLDCLLIFLGLILFKKSDKVIQSKRLIINLLLVFFVIITLVFSIEMISFIVLKSSKNFSPETISNDCNGLEQNKDRGYVFKKNYVCNHIMSLDNGSIIFNVNLTTDPQGRRIVYSKYSKNKPHLLFFGCSITFGYGLEDNETLPYMISKSLPGYNIYNYAVSGYGPQHMLALLENGHLSKEVESKNGIAIYVFITSHVDRAIGSSFCDWIYTSPYYFLDGNGKLQRDGSFITGRGIITSVYILFSTLKSKSSFLRLINLNLPPRFSKKDVLLTYEIIARSKSLYEEQFNGTFYVLIHPYHLDTPQNKKVLNILTNLFEKNNITALDYSSMIPDLEGYRIPIDGHPNVELNRLVSDRLIEDLNFSKDPKLEL